MTDIRLFQVDDDGEIEFADPDAPTTDLKLDTGLETAVYLSWFGGNARDPGLVHDDTNPDHPHRFQWWGNHGEPRERQMISETQHLLRSLPATSNNLLRIEDAQMRDVQWMLDTELASEVVATATLVAKDRIELSGRIIIDKQEFVVAFQSLWGE